MGGNTNHGPSNTVIIVNMRERTVGARRKLVEKRMLHKGMFIGKNKR